MKALVYKDDGVWRWECPLCPYTSTWHQWHIIFDLAFKHVSRHRFIGFRGTNG